MKRTKTDDLPVRFDRARGIMQDSATGLPLPGLAKHFAKMVVDTAAIVRDYDAFLDEQKSRLKPGEKIPAELTESFWARLEAVTARFDAIAQDSLRDVRKKALFVFPSNRMMFSILALFIGKSDRIPRELKPYAEMNEAERKDADARLLRYMNADESDDQGRPFGLIPDHDGYKKKDAFNVLLTTNAKIRATAKIDSDLFASHNPIEAQHLLSRWLSETFGPKGLKHFLAFLIQLDDAGRTGRFTLDLDKHADLVGATWKAGGKHRAEAKREAAQFIYVLSNLYLTTVWREGDKDRLHGVQLFNVPSYDAAAGPDGFQEYKSFEVEAGRAWYLDALEPKQGAQQFVMLFRKIAKENAQEHRNTVLLAPLLAIYWRIDKTAKHLKLKTLLEWCDLMPDEHRHFRRNLTTLKAELDYMKTHGYLGDWRFDGQADDLNATLTLEPPRYLAESLAGIQRALPSDALAGVKIDRDAFKAIVKASGMTQKDFANSIGVTHSYVSMVSSGKRPVTPELSRLLRKRFGPYVKAATDTVGPAQG